MKMPRKAYPRREVISLERVTGNFDLPHYAAQAEAEATELSEAPGGRFTFASLYGEARLSGKYEREALSLRRRALRALR